MEAEKNKFDAAFGLVEANRLVWVTFRLAEPGEFNVQDIDKFIVLVDAVTADKVKALRALQNLLDLWSLDFEAFDSVFREVREAVARIRGTKTGSGGSHMSSGLSVKRKSQRVI